MTKVEIEKPVVSKELAEAFDNKCASFTFVNGVINVEHYSTDIPEYKWLSYGSFENLLAKMVVLGYEIKKEKQFEIPTGLYSKNGEQYVVFNGFDYFAIGMNNSRFRKFQHKFAESKLGLLPKWCRELAVEVKDE